MVEDIFNVSIRTVLRSSSVTGGMSSFQTNDEGRLAPLKCHEYSTVKHIKIAQ